MSADPVPRTSLLTGGGPLDGMTTPTRPDRGILYIAWNRFVVAGNPPVIEGAIEAGLDEEPPEGSGLWHVYVRTRIGFTSSGVPTGLYRYNGVGEF